MVLANSKYTIEFVVKVQNSSIGLFYQTRTWYLTNLLCTFIWHNVEMLLHYFFNFLDKHLDFFVLLNCGWVDLELNFSNRNLIRWA